jgi:class 3 adenylate cyclase
MCLTIVFWDLSGFSYLCRQLTDNQPHIISFLKEYFDEGAKIITNRKGILDKFIGDGIMAYFGYPRDDSNKAPIDAITSALEFRVSTYKGTIYQVLALSSWQANRHQFKIWFWLIGN